MPLNIHSAPALKIKKIGFTHKVLIQPCMAKSHSAPSGAICQPKQPHQRLFQPTLRLISALASKSTQGNWTVLALIKGAKLDSKIVWYLILLTETPHFRTDSIRKLSNFSFQWIKSLHQNNLNNSASFFAFFKSYRYN